MSEETLIPNPNSETLISNPNSETLKTQEPITLSDKKIEIIETFKPKSPPVKQIYSRNNNPYKRGTKKFTSLKGKKKIQTLLHNIKPKVFLPKKNLNLDKFDQVLKKLDLFEFTRIEFDPVIRIEFLAELVSNYDPKKKCSYVNGFRINVTKNDLARALKLPAKKPEKGSAKTKDEVDLDSDVYSEEEIGFIENFVFNWMLVGDEEMVMPSEIVDWTRCIRDGHPEKMDAAKLIWYKVEKELTQGEKLVECYYASHLQCLIQSQRPNLFLGDYDGVGVSKEVVKVEDDNDEKEIEEKEEKEVKEIGKVESEDKEVKVESEEDKKVKVESEDKEVKVESEDKEVKVESEDKEVKVESEDKEETDEKDDGVSIVKENGIQLTLGPDAEEIVHEEVHTDDVVMVDAEEFKVDDVTYEVEEEVAEEQGNWGLDGKNALSDNTFLQRCQNSALNPYMETKAEEVEDDQIEQLDDDDDDEEEEEEEEEEAGGERMDDGFGMQANADSMDRDGLTGNFLQGVETSHIPYNNHGMSSMDLFGSRDNSFMDHGGPSFFNNGKRLMEPEDDMHHLDGNNKRLRTNDMLDHNQNDFGYLLEQMHQLMEKAKMLHESKEQNYANSQYNQQLAISQLQDRQNMLELMIKSKDQELETKRSEVFRLERELFLMSDLVQGLRGALKSTRDKFSDYRKRYHVQEKPLYQDAGPGGLVLSTREIEARRRKQEEDMMNIRMMANSLEQEFVNQFKVHDENIMASADKLASVGAEFEKLKEMAEQLREARKLQKSANKNEHDVSVEIEENQNSLDGNELFAEIENQKSLNGNELSAEIEENQKLLDGNELSAEIEENQKSLDGNELSAEIDENQKSFDGNELSADIDENQKSLDGNELSVEIDENQKSLDGKELAADMDVDLEEKQESIVDNEVGTEPEEIQKDEQDEVMETDAKPEGGPTDADEAKETEGNED